MRFLHAVLPLGFAVSALGCRPEPARPAGPLADFSAPNPGRAAPRQQSAYAGARDGGQAPLVPSQSQDLGRVPVGESRTARFPVRNGGRSPLKLLEVKVSCGCLKPEYPRTLGPGEAGEVRVEFRPEPLWSGRLEKRMTVRTDDPAHPEILLALSAEVIPYIRIEPPSPLLIPYRKGGEYSRTLRLTPREGLDLRITDVMSDSPLVRPRLEGPTKRGGAAEYSLHLKIGPCNVMGDFIGTVRLQTSLPTLPILPVVVAGQAQTGPVVSPRQIVLSFIRPDQAGKVASRVQVFARSGSLKLKGVESTSPYMQAAIVERSPGRFYDVEVTYKGGAKPGPLEGKLKVHIGGEGSGTLEIPLHATIQ